MAPMWRGRAHSRCGCGKTRPSPGADVSRGAPGRVQHCLFACAAVGYRTAAPHTALPRRSCGQRATASNRRTLLPPQLDFVGQPLADTAACSVQSTRTTDDVGPHGAQRTTRADGANGVLTGARPGASCAAHSVAWDTTPTAGTPWPRTTRDTNHTTGGTPRQLRAIMRRARRVQHSTDACAASRAAAQRITWPI